MAGYGVGRVVQAIPRTQALESDRHFRTRRIGVDVDVRLSQLCKLMIFSFE